MNRPIKNTLIFSVLQVQVCAFLNICLKHVLTCLIARVENVSYGFHGYVQCQQQLHAAWRQGEGYCINIVKHHFTHHPL